MNKEASPIWPRWAWGVLRLMAPMTAYVVARHGGVWIRSGRNRLRWEQY